MIVVYIRQLSSGFSQVFSGFSGYPAIKLLCL